MFHKVWNVLNDFKIIAYKVIQKTNTNQYVNELWPWDNFVGSQKSEMWTNSFLIFWPMYKLSFFVVGFLFFPFSSFHISPLSQIHGLFSFLLVLYSDHFSIYKCNLPSTFSVACMCNTASYLDSQLGSSSLGKTNSPSFSSLFHGIRI